MLGPRTGPWSRELPRLFSLKSNILTTRSATLAFVGLMVTGLGVSDFLCFRYGLPFCESGNTTETIGGGPAWMQILSILPENRQNDQPGKGASKP